MLTEVAQGIWVHQSELLANNTVVVQGENGVLIVDAGITGTEMSCLAGDLRALDLTVAAGFATHPDWDHVLWHEDLGDVPRYGTARCADFMQDFRARPDWQADATEGLPPEIADDVPLDLFGLVTPLPDGATHVPWDGPSARVIEHPAHAPGHAALLIEECRVLAAGDMLSDLFVPMLDVETPDPLADYLAGLRALEGVADLVDVVVPGHGSATDHEGLLARLAQDRAYVEALPTGGLTDDPRIGPSVKPGWEWVVDIHTGQLDSLARKWS